MKKSILTTLIISTSTISFGQTKKEYFIYDIPHYDSVGNLYQAAKTYDHFPTAADSADFFLSAKNKLNEIMNNEQVENEKRKSPIKKAIPVKRNPQKKF